MRATSKTPMAIDSVQGALQQAKIAAGIIKRRVSVHNPQTLLHHSFTRSRYQSQGHSTQQYRNHHGLLSSDPKRHGRRLSDHQRLDARMSGSKPAWLCPSLDSLIASSISCLATPLFKPGTSNGERRGRVDRGTMAYVSPLRRFITTSSVFDSSRILDSFSLASEYV